MIRVCGLIGSLRKGSMNRGLMRAAMEMGREEGLEIHLFDRLREIPPYDQDFDIEGSLPEPVAALKESIRNADALLIATPEYNYGVPGVLKNAIDWASRPATSSPLKGKPVAIMGASSGMSGTIRAQLSLRQSLLFTESHVLLKPEVLIPKAADRFDEQVNLIDQSTRDHIRKQLRALNEWTQLISQKKV
jgi:chromate reductase